MASRLQRASALRALAAELRQHSAAAAEGLAQLRLAFDQMQWDDEDRANYEPEFEDAAHRLTAVFTGTFDEQQARLEALAQRLDEILLGAEGIPGAGAAPQTDPGTPAVRWERGQAVLSASWLRSIPITWPYDDFPAGFATHRHHEHGADDYRALVRDLTRSRAGAMDEAAQRAAEVFRPNASEPVHAVLEFRPDQKGSRRFGLDVIAGAHRLAAAMELGVDIPVNLAVSPRIPADLEYDLHRLIPGLFHRG